MSHILTHITQQYQSATIGWYNTLFPMASHLFGGLAIIELAWSGISWMLEHKDISTLWSELLKKIITISFFYAILLHAHEWLPAIIKSFMLAGSSASHIQSLDPSSIFDQGISIASSVFKPLGLVGLLTSPLAIFIGVITTFTVLFAFATISGFLIVSLIESYFVVGSGILLLGFSSNRFTAQFATGFLSYAFSVGAKLFTLYLIVGVGSHMTATWGEMLTTASIKNFSPFFEVMGGALVYVFLAWSIPHKAESLIHGSSGATFTGLSAVSTAVGAAGVGSALMATRTVKGAASHGMQAIQQAHTIASHHQGNPIIAGAKGVLGASGNLLKAAASSLSGFQPSTQAVMAEKTASLKSHPPKQPETGTLSNETRSSPQASAFTRTTMPQQATTRAPRIEVSP